MTPSNNGQGGAMEESKPVTQGVFFEQIRQLREDIQAKHESTGRKIDDISEKIEQHTVEDKLVSDRVLTIEIERRLEKTAANVIASGVMAIVNRRIALVAIVVPIMLTLLNWFLHVKGYMP